MARLTDKQRKKIIADYIETQSVNMAAKLNKVGWKTARSVIEKEEDLTKKIELKKAQNTADILAYMESKRNIICEIIGNGLEVLRKPEKLEEASPAQITTALGTLIDKWSMVTGTPEEVEKEDALSKSLKELAEELESDD